tara:strand:- start:643 stop:834 length:192 start_codon:yes stop_codon:yes gene_type:complete
MELDNLKTELVNLIETIQLKAENNVNLSSEIIDQGINISFHLSNKRFFLRCELDRRFEKDVIN